MFSEDDKEYYSQGSCHEFAIAMHRLYGYSFVVALSHEVHGEDEDGNDIQSVIHVYSWDKEKDELHDVFGTIPYEQIKKDIDEKFLTDVYEIDFCYSEDELKNYIDNDENFDRPLTSFSEKDIETAKDLILLHKNSNSPAI